MRYLGKIESKVQFLMVACIKFIQFRDKTTRNLHKLKDSKVIQKYSSLKGETTHYKMKSPFTIDKSADWGDGNVQRMDAGDYVQVNSEGIITHAVKANEEGTAPVGWYLVGGNKYLKFPVFAVYVEPNISITLDTLDGVMTYNTTETGGFIVSNSKRSGKIFVPNSDDEWFVTYENFVKNYRALND